MKIDDVLGIGKILPIDKLIDVISNSVGRISKPFFDKKDVDTKAYEIEKLAEARAKEMKIIAEAVKDNFQITGNIEYRDEKIIINSPKNISNEVNQVLIDTPILEERTQERINFKEAKKQLNIESVTAFAAEQLKNEQPITDEPLDENWTTRFFNIAEEVSNEGMQALWGKILAGEIKQPKTYSLRTLELLRNLSRNEATIFSKIANFALKIGNSNFIFKTNDEKLLTQKYNINYGDIALLTEIGLLQPGEFVSYQIHQQNVDSKSAFISGNIIIIAEIKANTPTIQMPVHVFTTAGNELLKLINTNTPFDYLKAVAKSISNNNVSIKYGYILAYEGDRIRHTQPLQEFI